MQGTAPVALVWLIPNFAKGAAIPIPIRSVDASVLRRLLSESPSNLASKSAPVSLKIKVPPSKETLPVALSVPPEETFPMFVKTSKAVEPSV